MAVTIDYATKIISVPQADLTFISGTLYEMDVDWFRQQLNTIADSEEGIWADTTHTHNTEVTIAGTTFARQVEIINGYSVQFTPDSQWTVNLVGANTNLFDVAAGKLVQNQVQVVPSNSAGLVVTDTSGLTGTESAALILIEQLLRNKLIIDPNTGTATLYADDSVTPLISGLQYEDAAGTQTYRSQGLERRERME